MAERITKEYLKQFLPDNPVILEAGAHNGRDTLKMHKIWPQSTIYAFEPVPALYNQLCERVAPIPSIHCYNYALSDHAGIATLYVSSGRIDAASSLLKPTTYWENDTIVFNPIEVQTITLDAWATQNNVKKIDFMWLDMQGVELAVMRTAPQILASVKVILLEASLMERYVGAPLYPELKTFLEQNGFRIEQEDFFRETWGNVLFVR